MTDEQITQLILWQSVMAKVHNVHVQKFLEIHVQVAVYP